MITNETRAKLIGRTWMRLDVPCEGDGHAGCGLVPWDPEHDANAVAELRAFVRKRGKEAEFAGAVFGKTCAGSVDVTWRELWAVIDATPAQQCAAFDATFKDELEKIQ